MLSKRSKTEGWRDSPASLRPHTTIYTRLNRWSKQGVWEDVFMP